MRWLITGVIFLAVVVGWTAHTTWNNYLDTPISISSKTQYEIAPGASLGAVALDLEARGWLKRPRWFVWYARSRGDESRMRAGEYAIEPGTTPVSLLQLFVRGEVIQHAFTIIEGSTFADLRVALANQKLVKQTIPELTDVEVMTRLGFPGEFVEGRFLPETYYFTRGTSDLELLRRAQEMNADVLERLWEERAPENILKDPYEALILASIIEKETALPSEREKISGVFTRRLQKKMRLQSDPTVIYGLGQNYDGDIRKRDLTTDTPYNTYTRRGLPPTPIAMPGEASIYAALHPAPGSELFFVATGEPDGSHYFSDTIDEHNAAVRRYLARLKKKP